MFSIQTLRFLKSMLQLRIDKVYCSESLIYFECEQHFACEQHFRVINILRVINMLHSCRSIRSTGVLMSSPTRSNTRNFRRGRFKKIRLSFPAHTGTPEGHPANQGNRPCSHLHRSVLLPV